MRKQRALRVARTAAIAALYFVLTMLANTLNLAYGPIQFRFSEALTILPVFSPEAIPGLVIGCLLSNFFSPMGVADMVFGTLATLGAAVTGYLLRKVRIRSYPFLSVLMPVIFNAVIVAFELTFFTPDQAPMASVFFMSMLEVGAGEALVCFILGTALYYAVAKNKTLLALMGAAPSAASGSEETS